MCTVLNPTTFVCYNLFMRSSFLVGLFILGSLFLPTQFVLGATLYIDPGVATLARGDTITSSIRIMPNQSESECINSADIIISYPESLQPVDVSIGRSIFSVWVENPVINKENRTITLAGGIPNGYCGRVEGDPSLTNVIADIIFRSPGFQVGVVSSSSDTAEITFAPETRVLLNDGLGTNANLTTISSTINLTNTASADGISDEWRSAVREDKIPPEEFSIILERDPIAFNGRYFIIFSTADKQTGLSHYEVMEEPLSQKEKFNWGSANAPWLVAKSPYVLTDQTLNSTIRVRAIDKAGNEYIATLIPDESLRSALPTNYFTYLIPLLSVLLLLLLLSVLYFFIRKKYQRRTLAKDADVNSQEDNNTPV